MGGRELSVHIHPALFHNRDCEPRYLIGIAENEEREKDTLGIAVDTTQSDGPAPVMIGNSVSCSSSEAPTEVDGADWLQEVTFSLCLDGGGITIKSCSPNFTSSGGPVCEGQDFEKWITQNDFQHFHGWLQGASEHFLHRCYGMPHTNLVLKTPSPRSANFTCRSDLCTIDAMSYNSHTQQFTCNLTLHAVTLKRKGKKKKKEDRRNKPTPRSNEGGS